MLLSCGLLLVDAVDGKNDQRLLMCKVTLAKPERWDIPKGIKEDNETMLACMMREVFEETGLCITTNPEYLGIWDYTKNKQLALFYQQFTSKYGFQYHDTSLMSCSTYFERYGKQYPEVDAYKYVPFDQIVNHASKTLYPILHSALNLN